MTATIQRADAEQFAHQWREWHTQHEARIGDRHGFLAVTSINWLDEMPQRFEDAPGEWSTNAIGAHVTLADGEEIFTNGQPVVGSYDFGVIPERGGVTIGWRDGEKDVAVEVAKRGGYDIVRPRHVYDAPGRIEFELGGRPLALTVFANEHGSGYLTLFTDETSGVTTWPANRSLFLGVPADDGTVIVDFNRATNLPCAYTDVATCPLPPAENKLPVAVEAGEQIPNERA